MSEAMKTSLLFAVLLPLLSCGRPDAEHADTGAAMHVSSFDSEDPITVGGSTLYVIEARNEGVSVLHDVVLADRIPAQMSYEKSVGPTRGVLREGAVRFEVVRELQPGEKLVYRIFCKAAAAGSAKNAATFTYREFDGPITIEEGTTVNRERVRPGA